MKAAIAILLFVAMMGQIFQGDFIILDYYTHQQQYAELCVNKDKPQMHCNGQCQMSKKLQQAHNQESHNPEATGSAKVVLVLYCFVENFHINWVALPLTKIQYFPQEEHPIRRDLFSVFHPPEYFA